MPNPKDLREQKEKGGHQKEKSGQQKEKSGQQKEKAGQQKGKVAQPTCECFYPVRNHGIISICAGY